MNSNIWIEVNLKNLAANLQAIKTTAGRSVKIMGVVKQNAYGHGLIPIARKLSKEKIDFLGINNHEEARELLAARIKTPLLILSNTIFCRNLRPLLQNKVRFTVMDEVLLRSLDSIAKRNHIKALIHIKVDTGMSRLGLACGKAQSFIQKASALKNIEIEGLYSHLSSAETNYIYTFFQIHRFKNLLADLKKNNMNIELAHLCNSAGLVNFKDAHLDMVRAGLLLYGIKPHPRLKIEVEPVLSLKARVLHVKRIPKNSFISYANTFKTKKDTVVGVVSCGYAYGYPWNLSGKARVLIKGRLCRVLGRICMDHIVVDLSPLASSVKVGDSVTLIGKDGDHRITAERLAKDARTIPYEIVSGLSPGIPRVSI